MVTLLEYIRLIEGDTSVPPYCAVCFEGSAKYERDNRHVCAKHRKRGVFYPREICLDCGRKYGKNHSKSQFGVWMGTCDICRTNARCCAPRDFGHLRDDWTKERKE